MSLMASLSAIEGLRGPARRSYKGDGTSVTMDQTGVSGSRKTRGRDPLCRQPSFADKH
jgi:hypothetical protein